MVAYVFNANEHQPSEGGGQTVPAGTYDVAIIKSEEKPNKAQNGSYLQFTLGIISGSHVGKKLTARFNIRNPSDEAVRIGLSELSAMSWVLGVPYWQTTEQLHGRPFKVNVDCVPRNDKPDQMSNNIIGYMDAWGNPPTPATSGQSSGVQAGQPQYPQQSGMQPPPNPQMQPPSNQGMQPPMNPQGAPNGAPPDAGYTQTSVAPPSAAPANYGQGGYGNGAPPMATPQGQYQQPPQQPPQGQYQAPPQGQYQPPPQGQQMPPQQPQNGGVAGPGNSPMPGNAPNYGTGPGVPPTSPPWSS